MHKRCVQYLVLLQLWHNAQVKQENAFMNPRISQQKPIISKQLSPIACRDRRLRNESAKFDTFLYLLCLCHRRQSRQDIAPHALSMENTGITLPNVIDRSLLHPTWDRKTQQHWTGEHLDRKLITQNYFAKCCLKLSAICAQQTLPIMARMCIVINFPGSAVEISPRAHQPGRLRHPNKHFTFNLIV